MSRENPTDIASETWAAQKDGAFAGLTAGLAGAVVGRILGFGKYKTIFSGVLTGLTSGYYFTQGFVSSRLAVLEYQQAMDRERAAKQEMPHQTRDERS